MITYSRKLKIELSYLTYYCSYIIHALLSTYIWLYIIIHQGRPHKYKAAQETSSKNTSFNKLKFS